MRSTKRYSLSHHENLKHQILLWAQQFNEVIWLDGNDYPLKHSAYRAVLAVDAFTALKTDAHVGFDKLDEYQTIAEDWLFGYLSYDLKNEGGPLQSHNYDGLEFPDLYFFQPKKVFLFYDDRIEAQYLNMVADEMDKDWNSILQMPIEHARKMQTGIPVQCRTSKEDYIKKVEKVLEHIHRDDIYEVNLCQEFYSENSVIEPFETFQYLNGISKPPFAAFLKLDEFFALSASPERYIKRLGKTVVSQPIKGTARRSKNRIEDLAIADRLVNNPKERTENIMVVDLVRDELSKMAEKGSVLIEELCQVYSFEQVHQLISTITCEVPHDISGVEVLRNTFPMGSMTGTPKLAAMKVIDEIEDAKRGLYSGSIGYFSPQGDFDFNVVIRSILFNSYKKYVSFSVGGAITIDSDPEMEYEECLLKAQAMWATLTNKSRKTSVN